MKTLSDKQKALTIAMLYPADKHQATRSALEMVINEGTSIYAAEASHGISKNTLNPKVKRVREMIAFIETINASE